MATDVGAMRAHVGEGIPVDLPVHPGISDDVDHAPKRRQILSLSEKKLALKNALRYFPPSLHSVLAPEFANELDEYGRISVSYTHLTLPTIRLV